jgi:hypothetical protein
MWTEGHPRTPGPPQVRLRRIIPAELVLVRTGSGNPGVGWAVPTTAYHSCSHQLRLKTRFQPLWPPTLGEEIKWGPRDTLGLPAGVSPAPPWVTHQSGDKPDPGKKCPALRFGQSQAGIDWGIQRLQQGSIKCFRTRLGNAKHAAATAALY